MTRHKIEDITIIGAGPVGLFAAFYAGLRGLQVKLIDSLSELGGQPAVLYPEKLIYDIPAYPAILAKDLVANLVQQLDRFQDRTTICLNEEVLAFEKKDGLFSIKTTKQEHLSRAIIVACGNGAFSARPLGLTNEADFVDKTLFYQVGQLGQFKDKNLVICGGGDSAVDWALTLETIAKRVVLVHRRDSFRAHEYSVDRLAKSSVSVLTPYRPVALSGQNGQVERLTLQEVKTKEKTVLSLDALIVSFGFSTSNKHLKNWQLDYHRNRILVSPQLETSQAGIYAIGDVASYEGKTDLIATGFGEAPLAINQIIKHIYPDRDNRLVHSTSLIKESFK